MIPKIARAIYNNLPTPIVGLGFWVYTNTYVPIFASGKKTYDLGEFKMNIDQNESSMMISRRFRHHESEVSELISDEISRGSTYIDIGSNKGYHVLEAATIVGNQGIVYCFEPNSDNFSDLQDNIELNGFSNVKSYNKAVYDESGTALFRFGGKSGHGSVSQDGDIEVDTITFDNFLDQEGIAPTEIDCIKIDVEGGEASVLDGMSDFLGHSSDCTIIVEVHSNADIQRMSEILHKKDCDFRKFDGYWMIKT